MFWIIFGTSKKSTKYGPPDPLLMTKTLQTIKEKTQTSFKIIILHISTSKNTKPKILDTAGHHKVENYVSSFVFSSNSGGPKAIGFSQRFKQKTEFCNGGILISLGNPKISKHM